ncbi:hypothetical protein ACTXM3_17985 [Glutamicibacter arilaitensis]|uniref:Uncharacterized protein n=1 Tax=Glutamicibacter arilaitensis TaxID=256701 RepID=A0A2N7RXF0_9MICC|nr:MULTISPECIES: hypothetical protein [Glutamicibacter]PMQ18561.1 hypothetical protein CIK84_18550 [Glutamicibacter arilaitensis]HCJ54989.1 hypothetical protein [Glutamicibacter sp.]HCM94248.1 hypothetical protein [Glutamicibacter sp.]
MKITFYAAFAAMVIGAMTVILMMPALFNEPSASKESLMIWAGIVFLAGLVIVRLLKRVVTKET